MNYLYFRSALPFSNFRCLKLVEHWSWEPYSWFLAGSIYDCGSRRVAALILLTKRVACESGPLLGWGFRITMDDAETSSYHSQRTRGVSYSKCVRRVAYCNKNGLGNDVSHNTPSFPLTFYWTLIRPSFLKWLQCLYISQLLAIAISWTDLITIIVFVPVSVNSTRETVTA